MAKKDGKAAVEITIEQLIQMYETQRNQLINIENYKNQLTSMLIEIDQTLESLKEIENVEDSKEILISLGSGIYANATIKSVDKIKMLISNNIAKELTIKEAKKRLEKRRKSIENNLKKAAEDERKLLESLQSIEAVLQQLQLQQLTGANVQHQDEQQYASKAA